MKFIITENQYSRLESHEMAEKMFSKYWNRLGPRVDDRFFKLFGFSPVGLHIGTNVVTKKDVYGMLRKWLGEDEAVSMAKKVLEQKHFKVDNCGGYNFDFEVVDYDFEEDFGEVHITIKPDTKNGFVDLIMIGGGRENLDDALYNDDYGWEVEGELTDCVYELLHEKITNTTGYEIGIKGIA